MLAEARRKADEHGVAVERLQGDMREFELGRTFDLVFIAANSLLHLQEPDDLVECFRSVRRHLSPGSRLVFDVFNPSVRTLAQADGVRRRRDALSFVDPDRGVVMRSIFPQELPLLLALGGLRVLERFGDWSRGPTHF